jgi:hypothetical protein
MFDRAHVDSTGRTAAGPLNHYSQTETAVWSGGANLAAAKVALSGVAWCLALGWLDYGQGIAVWPILALALGLVVMGLTLLLLVVQDALQFGESQNCTSSTSLYHFTRSPIFARIRQASGLGSTSRRRRRASTRETRRVFCSSSS